MTPEERSESARHAANERHKKRTKDERRESMRIASNVRWAQYRAKKKEAAKAAKARGPAQE